MLNSLKSRLPALFLLILGIFQIQAYAQDFKDTAEALSALRSKDPIVAGKAVTYLAARPQESTPILVKLVEEKDDGWVYAMSALTSTKQESVVLFYIKLLENNMEAEAGERPLDTFELYHGRTTRPNHYGGVIAYQLGVLEDRRAIPVLQRAVREGGRALKEEAYKALYRLKSISLDELFQIGHAGVGSGANILEVITGIGWDSIHSETEFALGIFDRIISEFPEEDDYVASSYFWKVQCYEILREYELAIEACDEVLRYPQFEDMVEQIKSIKADLIKKFEQRQQKVRDTQFTRMATAPPSISKMLTARSSAIRKP